MTVGGARPSAEGPADGEVRAHVFRHLGPVRDLVVDAAGARFLHAAATPARPFQVVVTTGMSAQAMSAPPGAEAFRFAELFVLLPHEWPLHPEALGEERWHWPLRLLHSLAELPRSWGAWLGVGHTVGNGDPPGPYARDTSLCGALLVPPVSLDDAFFRVDAGDGRRIHLLQVVPLHACELALKLEHGGDALVRALSQARVSDVIDPARPPACPPVARP